MKTICVSSSSKFADKWKEIAKVLDEHGIKYFLPDDVSYKEPEKEIVDNTLKATVMDEFFKFIDESDILYLLCPNGYIGISAAVEAGYAYAKGKEIISSELVGDIGIRPLVSDILDPLELVGKIMEKTK